MDEIHSSNISVFLVGSSYFSSPQDCCTYLITDNKSLSILVDVGAGNHHSVEKICNNIQKIHSLDRVKYILITHAHIDHVGGLKQIKTNYLINSTVIAHKYAANVIKNEDSIRSAAKWYNTNLQSANIDIEITKTFEINLNGGNLRIIPTPGHTPGSVIGVLTVYDSDKRIIFGHDIHGPFMPEWKSDIGEWLTSMKIILNFQPDYLCEGHFGIIRGREKVEKFIKEYITQFSN